ncbi:unnamed protein product (macronuclear) [Paramecium tetraurelia]|uniref:EF-hand domain-containing protein n=1 Tax=Paramecium tetraurelia TaxID=5888 RepID=A0BSR5_PARTE|nr:uncharacterized protein GSPATT00031814001 [Paramecium tetraurelia]CAK61582.1 unnamed protein product [Paramecium tetraurelia]|eukprot:XP_001428980.1 hypothetical protein (macronuclear) [Paramecium tetraurelia strain d4-2]
MTDLLERSIHLINNFVSQWTKKYLYYTSYIEETSSGHTFMTVFSLPTPSNPIPVATVKVYFYIPDLTDPSERTMSFRFENDSLIHLVNRTIRISQMEKWIETILARKDRTCRIMFLGTEFEQTRIINKRMDEVLYEKQPEQEKENLVVQPELLEHDQELVNQFTITEEEKIREIKMLTELLYQCFRQIDKDDMGVISYEEGGQLFQLMGLHLGKHQLEDTLNRLDVSRTGILQFKDISSFGIETLHSIYCQNQALKELREKEEESRFEAQWMLSTDLRNVYKKIVEQCKLKDEDEIHSIPSNVFQQILEEQQFFTEDEIKQIMEIIGDKAVEYETSDKVLEETIFENLVKGLLEAQKSKMEVFLLEHFRRQDKDNTGFIKINELMIALKSCEKIKLSKVQLYSLQSYIKRNDKDLVNYKQETRKIGAIIKKFFNVDLMEQRSRLPQHTKIDAYIPLKTPEQIQEQIKKVGS